ncbi:MAG: hypothetical protein CMB82_05715 [Flammeovirgaceae bacterium]|nr:hypothetical protein [Flammeovirgaceae bacterium]|tara:strand:+ start:1575 stop:2234 length:660 start_codon:yes stop_codon:yes gene_type:complete
MALELLTIKAYKSASCSFSDYIGEYNAQLNPTEYSKSWKTNSVSVPTGGGSGPNLVMVKPADPENISLKFTIDDTGAIPGGNVNIVDNVANLKELCLDVNDDTHTTNYLSLEWGSLELKCKMTDFSVVYKLFDFDGFPIRAEINANFTEFIDVGSMLEGYNSPDMSHIIEVKQGDNLPLMCKNIYGDPNYYLQVAEANNIIDFRNLIPGQKILFPRLEK